MSEKIIAEVKALIDAPSCCAEAKQTAEDWLATVGTDKEAEQTKKLVAELEEDIMPIDGLVAFASSPQCAEIFGDKAEGFLAHAEELKASGAKYCDCPACAACEKILYLLKA